MIENEVLEYLLQKGFKELKKGFILFPTRRLTAYEMELVDYLFYECENYEFINKNDPRFKERIKKHDVIEYNHLV